MAGGEVDGFHAACAGVGESRGEKLPCQPTAAAMWQDAGTDLAARGVHHEMQKAEELGLGVQYPEAGIAREMQSLHVGGDGVVAKGAGEAPIAVVTVQRQQVRENDRAISGG